MTLKQMSEVRPERQKKGKALEILVSKHTRTCAHTRTHTHRSLNVASTLANMHIIPKKTYRVNRKQL